MRFVIVIACCLALLSGCQQTRKLRVARLDTAELLQSDPRYQEYSVEYLRQQTDIRRKLIEALQKAGSDSQKKLIQDKFTKEQQQLNQEWSKKTNDFLADRHEKIKNTTEQICKAKSIDMVVIDSKYYPTVEWGAVNITQDVALQMVGGK